MSVYGERMVRVEVELNELKQSFQEHKSETAKKFTEVNDKLDTLLALRNKGAGVIWLMSGVVGTGFLGGVYEIARLMFGGK